MATLLDALSDGSYDLQNKRDISGDFGKRLLDYRNAVVSEFLKYNIELSKAISNIAKRDSLNEDQIKRIVEEVNNQVYLVKYDQLKGSPDRDVEFDLASIENVKKHMRGESVTVQGKETDKPIDKDEVSSKAAFEINKFDGLEKVASAGETFDLFNGISGNSYGDLSIEMRESRDEFMLRKIAETINDKTVALDKVAKEVNHYASELGDTFTNIERLGSDVDEVMSAIVKAAGLNDNEINLIKEATEKRVTMMKERNYVPSEFDVVFGEINTEKKASEKFNLGKHSFLKTASVACDTKIPNICLSTNKVVSSIDDIVKIASTMKERVDTLCNMNNEYIAIREKCAEQGISSEDLEGSGFFD